MAAANRNNLERYSELLGEIMNVRNKRVVKNVNLKSGTGLELGPLTSPVVKKSEGDIYYLDHMSQADLRKKYKNEPVDLDKIVPVDYVLKSSLKDTVGKKKFDYVIASHVIEHIPDTVSWLHDVSSILNPGGILSLVIPDKRFTFDIERNVSQPTEVISSYIDKLEKPTSSMMYDFASLYAENIDAVSVWRDADYYLKLPPKHRWSHEQAVQMCLENTKPGEYIDCHCYVYTPASFIEILRKLTKDDLIDFELCSFMETQENEIEFYVSLKKIGRKSTKSNRLRKLPEIEDMTKLHHLEERLDSLAYESYMFEKEIEAIRDSVSWRVTAPLRKVSKSLKRKQ